MQRNSPGTSDSPFPGTSDGTRLRKSLWKVGKMFWTIIVSSLAFSVFALIAIVIVTRAIENRRLVSRYKPDH